MLKAIARIKSAQAVARANGHGNAEAMFARVIHDLEQFATAPYILHNVLTPEDVDPSAPPLLPRSRQEAHDQVQAGVLTREKAVDVGVIENVDQIPAPPEESPFKSSEDPRPAVPPPTRPGDAPPPDLPIPAPVSSRPNESPAPGPTFPLPSAPPVQVTPDPAGRVVGDPVRIDRGTGQPINPAPLGWPPGPPVNFPPNPQRDPGDETPAAPLNRPVR